MPHAAFQILHIAVNIAGCCGELHNRCVAQVIAAPDAFHLIAGIGFDGIDTFDAGRDHAVALRQPVHVIDVGVALDGRVTIGIGKACTACAEPVAHDSTDGALTVVIDDGRVFNRHLIALGQIIQHRHACNDLTGLHIECQQLDWIRVVGEHHKIRRQRRGAAAAPGKTAAGGLVVFAADLRADALIRCAPDSLDTVIGTQQIAVLVCQDDRAVLGGGNPVFRALAERQPVDEDGLRKVGLLSVQDCLDRRVGDVAEHALLLTLGIDAEAAGCKPEVSIVVKNHGQKILRQLLAERSLGCRLDVNVQYLFKFRQDVSCFIGCPQHQHMVVAGGADDAVFRVQERIGALDDVTAAVMLLWREIAQRRGFLRVQIADGDAAEQRNDCVAVAVKVNGRRSVRVGFFIGNIDLRIDAKRQDFIRRVGIVAVVVNVGVALCHIGVFVDTLGAQRLDRQCRGQCVGRRGLPCASVLRHIILRRGFL